MRQIKKLPFEREILARLICGDLDFPPLQFRPVPYDPPDKGIDLILQTEWEGQRAIFAVECKVSSSPKAIGEAARQAKAYADATPKRKYLPLVVAPFLNEERLTELKQKNINGIDLCGNGVIIVPGKFAVYRTGAPNRFRSSAPIKNIYQKNSSIVGRVFLARPRYPAVTEIQSEIRRRSFSIRPPLSLATVSKVLKGLEEDLIVSRGFWNFFECNRTSCLSNSPGTSRGRKVASHSEPRSRWREANYSTSYSGLPSSWGCPLSRPALHLFRNMG